MRVYFSKREVCLFMSIRRFIMSKTIEKEIINVENLIYEIRGKQVMLDYDLAKLYECAV